jgi:hypothetical protein
MSKRDRNKEVGGFRVAISQAANSLWCRVLLEKILIIHIHNKLPALSFNSVVHRHHEKTLL